MMTQEMKKGWKLMPYGLSWFADGAAEMRYIPGAWSVRKVGYGPLAVFTDMGSVDKFLDNVGYSSNEIREKGDLYPCYYIPSRHKALWYPLNIAEGGYIVNADVPSGTDFADAVYIIPD